VPLGVDTRSFRALPREPGLDEVDAIIRALTACDARACELFAPQVEPRYGGSHGAGHRPAMSVMSPQMMRRELRKWRLRTPFAHFRTIRDKFTRAGIAVYAYHYSPDGSFTNEEIDRGFGMAKALGAEMITASTTAEIAKRIVPFAEQHQMVVALRVTPAEAAQECAALQAAGGATKTSKYVKTAVDLGQLTACNLDAIAYLREQHAGVAALYLSDRKKNQGERVPWGEGDAPIREALQLLKREGWPIRASVSYEYGGQSHPVEEVRKGLAYARQATD
jgi:sugar phosphate isomerase/epimerase